MTLLAYLAAYAPELALWLRPRRPTPAREGTAEGKTGVRIESSTATAACTEGELQADGAALDDLAIRERKASAGADETAEMVRECAATLQPRGQEASVGVQGEAGAAKDVAKVSKPSREEASNGAARSGGGAGVQGALLDWRTLRLCASFSLQARGTPCPALNVLSTAWQLVLGLVCCVVLSNAARVFQQPYIASCHVCAPTLSVSCSASLST